MHAREPHAHLASLDARSNLWLAITIAGSLLGFFLIFGPLGWVFGGRLRGAYKEQGHHPKAAATATWLLGITMTISAAVSVLALVWFAVMVTFHG